MLTAKSDIKEKSVTLSKPESKKGAAEEVAPQTQLNPLWHGLATHVGNNAAAGAGDPSALQRKPSHPASVPHIQRMCAECGEELNTDAEATIQTKLTVGAPDDPYEKEADAVADQVMRMPTGGGGLDELGEDSPQIQTKPLNSSLIQRMCAGCGDESGNGDSQSVQTKSNNTISQNAVSSSVANTIHSPGSGSPLSESVRSRVEPVLGADLSSVRVHTGSQSQLASRNIQAKAFTHGNNIFLGAGQSHRDLKLMAHEATHTVQQSGTSPALQALQRAPLDEVTADPPESGVLPAVGGQQSVSSNQQPTEQELPMSRNIRGQFFHFGTYETGYFKITDDQEFMRYEMTRLITQKGLALSKRWVKLLVSRQGKEIDDPPKPFFAHTSATRRPVRNPMDMQREMQRDMHRQQIAPKAIPTTVKMFNEVYARAEAYLAEFEGKAKKISLSLLQTSEDKVKAEAARYGLKNPGWWQYTMNQGGDSAAMIGAASDLNEKNKEIRTLEKNKADLYETKVISYLSGMTTKVLPKENQAKHQALTEQIKQVQMQYQVLRQIFEQRYPILASFSQSPGEIAKIATGNTQSVAFLLQYDVQQKLSNIKKVRDELSGDGRVKIWKLPEIVQLTKMATQTSGNQITNAMFSKVVDDKRQEKLDAEFWTNLALGALAIGLAVLAAIPSGGSSLVAGAAALASLGSLGLGVYVASESIKDYSLEKAMTGTDFDKARAISSSDPSLFWLAVDIVGVALDLGPALRAGRDVAKTAMKSAKATYEVLAPLTRKALTAQGDDLAETLSSIRTAAKSDELGETVIKSIERMRGGTEAQQAIGKAAGHEAAARTALEASDSIGQKAKTVIGAHTVRVAPGSGALVICSQCIWARGMFASELAANSQFLARLEKLEEAGRIAAKSNDATAATKVAEQTRALADEMLSVRRARLHASARALSADEIIELGRLRNLDPPNMSQLELEQLQALREASGEAFAGRLVANTPDHKAERWLEYLARGGEKKYSTWSKIYQGNMGRAKKSHKAVEAFRKTLDWAANAKTQVLQMPFGPTGPRRILDIAEETVDPLTKTKRLIRAVEHKEGYIAMSDPIRAEIKADKALLRNGADITWHVDGKFSSGVRAALNEPPPIRFVETMKDLTIEQIRGH